MEKFSIETLTEHQRRGEKIDAAASGDGGAAARRE
jgi:hypothetical protein